MTTRKLLIVAMVFLSTLVGNFSGPNVADGRNNLEADYSEGRISGAGKEDSNPAEVSLRSLLGEMIHRESLALWPDPEYVCRQQSSYDRAAVSPQENWFANNDFSQFIREEENNGRKEWVLFDSDGPGAMTRFWIANSDFVTNLYFYVDGATEPEIFGKPDDLIGGNLLVPPPFSEVTANGRNLYFPIPYAKHLKITCDKMDLQKNFYYQINYRTYEDGTKVESFSRQKLGELEETIAGVAAGLSEPGYAEILGQGSVRSTLRFDDISRNLYKSVVSGPGMLTRIQVKLLSGDIAQATRNTVISITFDGQETVWCPVGEFFGSGIGINPFTSWYTSVEEDGLMTCWWPMPFEKSAEVAFHVYGNQPVDIQLQVDYNTAEWTDRSMYFHCNWRQDRNIPTLGGQGTMDWNFVTIKGKGVYVGDVLSVLNRSPEWWGEGDEKIYLDGERFPSHFGTGTEDYYGYAWGTPEVFSSPFHAQPRAEGPKSQGHITNLRFRILDAITFARNFKFDMEVWHWRETEVDYAVATFWYGLPGSKAVHVPAKEALEDEVSQPVSEESGPVTEEEETPLEGAK